MENPLKFVRDITSGEAHLFLLCFAGLISPGVLPIWYFQPALITEAGFLVLVLLALSSTVPMAFFNYGVIAIGIEVTSVKAEIDKDAEIDELTDLQTFLLGVGALAASAFWVMLASLAFDLSLKTFIISWIVLDLAVVSIYRVALKKGIV